MYISIYINPKSSTNPPPRTLSPGGMDSLSRNPRNKPLRPMESHALTGCGGAWRARMHRG